MSYHVSPGAGTYLFAALVALVPLALALMLILIYRDNKAALIIGGLSVALPSVFVAIMFYAMATSSVSIEGDTLRVRAFLSTHEVYLPLPDAQPAAPATEVRLTRVNGISLGSYHAGQYGANERDFVLLVNGDRGIRFSEGNTIYIIATGEMTEAFLEAVGAGQ